MFAWIVCDFENVEGDSVHAGLAQGVEPGDVRTRVVDLLHDGRHLGVVVVLELDRRKRRLDREHGQQQQLRQHLVLEAKIEVTSSFFDHTEKDEWKFLVGSKGNVIRPLVYIALSLFSYQRCEWVLGIYVTMQTV
jgi:hypothetical protein